MGSSRHRNSSSAIKARSSKTRFKRRSKPTKLCKAADALRAIKHARRSQSAEPLQMSPTQLVRDMRNGMPTTVLNYIRKNLELIQSAAIVVAHALREQNVELDDDAADVLRRHVSDALQDQIESIDSLLGGVAP
jgi:hypothetical protein